MARGRGRAVGADPAAHVHAPRRAGDAAAGARARPGVARVLGGTFHSVAHRLVRRHAAALGLPDGFGVLDAGDAADVLDLLREEHGHAKSRDALPAQGDAAGHLLAHGQRAGAAVGRARRALPVVRASTARRSRRCSRPTPRASGRSGVLDLDDLLLFWRALARRRGDRPAAGRVVRPRAGRRVPGRQRPAGRPRARARRRTGRRSPRSATTSRRSTASARPRRRTSSTSPSTSRARAWSRWSATTAPRSRCSTRPTRWPRRRRARSRSACAPSATGGVRPAVVHVPRRGRAGRGGLRPRARGARAGRRAAGPGRADAHLARLRPAGARAHAPARPVRQVRRAALPRGRAREGLRGARCGWSTTAPTTWRGSACCSWSRGSGPVCARAIAAMAEALVPRLAAGPCAAGSTRWHGRGARAIPPARARAPTR